MSLEIVFAISTSCCFVTDRELTGLSGSSAIDSRARLSLARLLIADQSTKGPRVCGCPREMFSATDSDGTSEYS